MKILVYSHDWAPAIGGTQTAMMSLAGGLASELRSLGDSARLTFVTATPAGEMDDRTMPFAVVRRPSFTELIRLIRTSEVVHLAGPALLPLFLSWLLRKKFVIQHHNYQAVCPDGLLLQNPDRSPCPNHFLNGRIRNCVRCHATNVGWRRSFWHAALAYPRLWLSRRAVANVAVSDHAAKRLSLPASRTIYNGTRSHTGLAATHNMSASPAPCVVYVGRLTPDKGVSVLISAAIELAEQGCEFSLRIIGDGPERASLQGLVRFLEYQHLITFTGFLEGEDLARATSDAVAIVMPSLSEETAGLAAIEQMMRGKLVIASDIGGLSEVLGSTGLKCAPGNSHELAQCIRQALEDPEMRVRLGAAARDRALAMFTEKRMVAEHLKLYEEVLGIPKRRKWSAKLIRRRMATSRQARQLKSQR
ncbi:MAG: glycosyltransferase family 4 protein [Candidatus Acidiferrales bacterium]|jgi:glycosyltransferase involved in cell wall biosynthesis